MEGSISKAVFQLRPVLMPYHTFLLRSSLGTSRNVTPSNGTVYKVTPVLSPFLSCDVIADKAHLAKSIFTHFSFLRNCPVGRQYVSFNA